MKFLSKTALKKLSQEEKVKYINELSEEYVKTQVEMFKSENRTPFLKKLEKYEKYIDIYEESL